MGPKPLSGLGKVFTVNAENGKADTPKNDVDVGTYKVLHVYHTRRKVTFDDGSYRFEVSYVVDAWKVPEGMNAIDEVSYKQVTDTGPVRDRTAWFDAKGGK